MLSVFLVAIELTMATGLWTAHALVDRRAPAVLRSHSFGVCCTDWAVGVGGWLA